MRCLALRRQARGTRPAVAPSWWARPAVVVSAPCDDADLPCLVQVNLDPVAEPDGHRGGAHPDTVLELARALAGTEGLRVGGVMAVAPLGAEPREAFETLWRLSQEMQREFPDARAISAGMSADLEAAVAAGATHVRIGSDVLGPRPAVR